MQLKHKLGRRLLRFLPLMLAGLALGLFGLPLTASGLLSTVISLLVFWFLARFLVMFYDPRAADPLIRAAISLLSGLVFSLFWAATAWFPEGSLLLAGLPAAAQAMIVAAVSLGLVLAIWKLFSRCVAAVFGDITGELRKKRR